MTADPTGATPMREDHLHTCECSCPTHNEEHCRDGEPLPTSATGAGRGGALTDAEREALKPTRRRCTVCAFYHRNGTGRFEDCTL